MDTVDYLISVCICTFRRPALLDGLLENLTQHVVFPGPTEIIVIDNDAKKSAEDIVAKNAANHSNLRYFNEPIQNISIARNRGVKEANGKWIAMIDDDEIPSKNWLRNLLTGAIEWKADAVFGPVVSLYPDATPSWVIKGGYLEKKRFATGSPLPRGETRTSNVLMRRDLITARDEPFDLQFGLSGGEDSRFFDQLVIEGKRFFWHDEAEVMEYVPEERTTARWLIRRFFRTGQTYGRIFLLGFGIKTTSNFEKLGFFLKSSTIALFSIPLFIVFLPFGKQRSFKWISILATQLGKISAFSSKVFEEYSD